MQNVIRSSLAVLMIVFSLSFSIKPAYSQTDTSGAEALGKAIGTLLGNMFSRNSGNSGSSDNFQSSSISSDSPSQDSVSLFKQKDAEIIDYIKSICLREDLKAFYEKTTCNNSELTMAHFVDSAKVTELQKKALLIIDEEYKKTAEMQMMNYRSNVKPSSLGEQLADVRLKYRIQSQKVLQELYLGKITWGQYNSSRRDIAQAGRDEFIKLSRQPGTQ
jgi:hypothetical protein